MNTLAKGIWCAMITPLDEREDIDREGVAKVAHHIVKGGVNALLVLGSTGEQIALDSRAKRVLAQTVRENIPEGMPMIVGCGATSTRLAIANVHDAEEAGADAVIVTPPCFYPFSAEALCEYYRRIAAESHVPVYLYNISRFVGQKIPVDTVRMLMNEPKIMGIKESDRDLAYVKQLLEATKERDDFAVIQGSERVFLESFDMGCPAGVTVVGNINAQPTVDLYKAWLAGNRGEAERLQALALRWVAAVTCLGMFPKELKIGCEAMGLCSARMTSPFPEATKEQVQAVLSAIHQLQV